jgi:hypothetical protein
MVRLKPGTWNRQYRVRILFWSVERTVLTYEASSHSPATTPSPVITSSPVITPSPGSTLPIVTPSHKTSAGAIAGGVIGGLAFIALIVAGIFLWLRHKRRQVSPGTELSQPVIYAKPDPPTSSVASSPPPVYPSSPTNPQNSFYPPMSQDQMRQVPVNDMFGRPLPGNPGGGLTNPGIYPPPAQGVSAYAPPPPQSVGPTNQYQHAPRQPMELSGEYTGNTGAQQSS